MEEGTCRVLRGTVFLRQLSIEFLERPPLPLIYLVRPLIQKASLQRFLVRDEIQLVLKALMGWDSEPPFGRQDRHEMSAEGGCSVLETAVAQRLFG